MKHESLVWYENGQSGYGGDLLRLHRRLDELFLSWAAQVTAAEYVFPPFLRASDLARIDYLKSFPHLATFPVTLAADEPNIDEFIAKLSSADAKPADISLTRTSPVADVLTPAACYHVYVLLRGSTLERTSFFTTKATCFRRETEYHPLERQWGFNMREIVCVGESEQVKAFLVSMQGKLESFFSELGLPVRFMNATDPFFRPAQNPKVFAQKLDPVKSEMVWEERLAVGSVNFHRNYFGEGYAIDCAGSAAFSGCVAFGVERWMSMILGRFGHDPKNWPTPFRLS